MEKKHFQKLKRLNFKMKPAAKTGIFMISIAIVIFITLLRLIT